MKRFLLLSHQCVTHQSVVPRNKQSAVYVCDMGGGVEVSCQHPPLNRALRHKSINFALPEKLFHCMDTSTLLKPSSNEPKPAIFTTHTPDDGLRVGLARHSDASCHHHHGILHARPAIDRAHRVVSETCIDRCSAHPNADVVGMTVRSATPVRYLSI